MSGPRDQIDAWLDREVELLPPPPGAFDRVRRQARRRKRRQALVAAAGAIVIIAGIAAAPQIGAAFSQHAPRPPGQSAAAGRSASPSRASHPATSAPPGSPSTSPAATTPAQAGTALSVTTSGVAPPANFRPTSITMIGDGIGAVLGQAGTPGQCAGPVPADCTSLAGTSDWGTRWYGVSAPVTSGPDGSAGVSQVRFLNLEDGWAFGPQLYVTTDGGLQWSAAQTYGMRVTDLEAAGNRAFAIFASCTGSGTDFAANCTNFSLYSAPAGSTTFTPVSLPSDCVQLCGGPNGATQFSASLALASDSASPEAGTGYLLMPSGAILSGPLTGAPWKLAGDTTPCPAGPAQPSGQPSDGLLAAGPTLLISCGNSIWSSADGGANWKDGGTAPGGKGTSLTTAGSDQAILASTTGIDYSADSGKTWQSATITGGTPAGGFSYVGMTTPTQGVALPAEASLGEVFVTSDGGMTWSPHPISGS